MVHRASARRGVTPAVRKRETVWFGSDNSDATTTTLGATAKQLDQVLTTAELARTPFTIIRTRGYVFIQSDQSASIEDPIFALGMAVVSQQAIDIGVTAVPDPYADLESDLWFMHTGGMISTKNDGPGGQVFSFDSKAMRKVEDGENVAVVIRNISSVFGLDFFVMFRMLIKTH